MDRDAGRILVLDGWRGIAIALVLIDHVGHALLHRYVVPWTQTGQHGVTIFFVLSGFLITRKLLEGPIDLHRFYLQRAFRLMPVTWAYLAVMLLLDRLIHTHFTSLSEVIACLFFYRNFADIAGTSGSGHFWSLSLEEQFYLVWPVLLLLAGIPRVRSIRLIRWVALAMAVACATYRYSHWAYYDRNVLNGQTHVRCDALLVGCLLALLLAEPRFATSATRWSKWLAIPALATLTFCLVRFHWLPPLYECVAIAILLAATMLHRQTILARLLSFKPLVWIGAISYSLYVWQALFMLPWPGALQPWLFGIALPLFAIGSYYWLELPGVRLGRKLTAARSSLDWRILVSRRPRGSPSGTPLPVEQQ
jgi:peptidoglycan/LPS O-acetylase OafA/YrhL